MSTEEDKIDAGIRQFLDSNGFEVVQMSIDLFGAPDHRTLKFSITARQVPEKKPRAITISGVKVTPTT